MSPVPNLNPQKALIFRISHRDNVPWILDHGLHSKNSNSVDPNFVAIGNADLIVRRSPRAVPHPPGGILGDYIPFYFTPFTPMLYNIKTGWNGIPKRLNEEIVILVSSLHRLRDRGVTFIFTDRHAYLATACYFSDLADLARIDWNGLQRRDFRKDPEDPEKVERYQAEALVHRYMPTDTLLGMVCYSESVALGLRVHLAERGLATDVHAKQGWYL